MEQTWCIAVEYQEKQAKPVTPLKNSKKSCGCGCGGNCGCGGTSADTGCGCGKPPGQCSCASKNGTTQTSALTSGSCEPTRIRETYCLSVMEEPEWCKRPVIEGTKGRQLGLATSHALLQLIPENSLLGRIIACWVCAFEILSSTVKNDDWSILFLAAEGKLPTSFSATQLHVAVCRLRQAVADLFAADTHNTRCQLIKLLDKIDCPPPQADPATGISSMAVYQPQVVPSIRNLVGMIAQYLLDCLCDAFLPPCSPDPLDNRVILACVTVKDGKILRICDFGCRSYAGSFPSLYYWLSAVPVASLVKVGLEFLCCAPDLVRSNSPLVNSLYQYLDRLDPDASKRTNLVANNFSGARVLLNLAGVWLDKVTLKRIRDILAAGFEGASGLSGQIGKDSAEVQHALEAQKVAVHFREVRSPTEMASSLASVAREGDQLLAYVKDGKVLGFTTYTTEERLRDKETEINSTLAELKALRDELRNRQG
jgi:hypothetical protein